MPDPHFKQGRRRDTNSRRSSKPLSHVIHLQQIHVTERLPSLEKGSELESKARSKNRRS